jgi:hypothetical protein
MGAGAVETKGGERVDLAIHGGHPRLEHVERLGMGYLARVQPGDHLARGHTDQFMHACLPHSARSFVTQPSAGASPLR